MDAYRIKSMGFCYKKMNFMGKKVVRESGGGEGGVGGRDGLHYLDNI
jgi:hypothetical protein